MKDTMVAESVLFGMGTVINHQVYGKNAAEVLVAANAEATRLEGLLSRFKPDSEISRINRSAGEWGNGVSGDGGKGIGSGSGVCVSSETYNILASAAVGFSKQLGGLFDITVGPLVDLWAGCKASLKPPPRAIIKSVLPLINYRDIIFTPDKKTVALKKPGQSIDLGGVGKGCAADRILDVFAASRIKSAFTNFGGNVATIGTKPDGSYWRVGIRHPRQGNALIGAVAIAGKSVVTSGDYQRFFIGSDGTRYHHILNPATGYPSESGLISATVVADSSMVADALSTALFVAGLHQGATLLAAIPGTEAILITADLQVHITPGLIDSFVAQKGINVSIINRKAEKALQKAEKPKNRRAEWLI